MYTSLIKGLNSCRIIHALREKPIIFESLVQEFWKTARFDALEGEGKERLLQRFRRR
ncbi:hypothetical protein Hanom_Chr14g01257791 [Helianthus anomalus]